MEERQDGAAIAARSSDDRDAIVERSKRNPLQDRRRCFHEDLQQDQRPIDARLGHDRGRLWSIPAKSVARKCGNRGQIETIWPQIPELRRRQVKLLP